MAKRDDHAINSVYLLGQCLGPLKVGPYYVRLVKAEQVLPQKDLCSPYTTYERGGLKYKLDEVAVKVRLR